jgi:hypothetical protein
LLLLPLLLVILTPLSATFRISFIFFLIFHRCFLHHSHLSLAHLSLLFAPFSVDFLTSFHVSCISFSCFSYLLSCSSHLLIFFSHISLLLLALLYCLLHFLICFWHLFRMLISVQSVAFNSLIYFSYLQYLILPPLLVTPPHLSLLLIVLISIASHTFLRCFSRFRQLLLLSLSITSYTLNSCFIHFFELFSRLSLLLLASFSVSSSISHLPLLPLSAVS